MSGQNSLFHFIFPLKRETEQLESKVYRDVLLGPSNSLKTSMLFQAAVTQCKDNQKVLFFRPRPLQYLPNPVNGMPNAAQLSSMMDNLQLVYIDQLESFITYLASFPSNKSDKSEENRSDIALLIVDDFNHYMDQIEVDTLVEQYSAKLCCLLLEVAEFCSRKRAGPVQLLISGKKSIESTLKYAKSFNRYMDRIWTVTPSHLSDQLIIEPQGCDSFIKYIVIERLKEEILLKKVGTNQDHPFMDL